MQAEISPLWLELWADLASPVVYKQLAILLLSLSLAWLLNRLLHGQVMHRAPETWKIGIGGAKRVLADALERRRAGLNLIPALIRGHGLGRTLFCLKRQEKCTNG